MTHVDPEADQRTATGPLLSLFDVTSLVIGAVVGAAIYVVGAQGVRFLGPAALVAWAVGGWLALTIALVFCQCALISPLVGGSYAYARAAFGLFPGFVTGWCLYLARLASVAVYPIAFTQYLGALVGNLTPPWEWLVRVAFITFIVATNCAGLRTAGTIVDVLAVAKLLPLVVLVLLGIAWIALNPDDAIAHVSPFAPLGMENFAPALVLVFWAFSGFEVASLPAGEIRTPRRILPLAIWWGMVTVTMLYLLVNTVTIAVFPWTGLRSSTTPLVDVAATLFRDLRLPEVMAVTLMAGGAIVSISGSGESVVLGNSRLGSQLATDGFLPQRLAYRHHRFGTPTVAILFQGGVSLALSFLGSTQGLITVTVFYLSIAYLATSLAAWRLAAQNPERRLAVPFPSLVPPVATASSLILLAASLPQASPIAYLGVAAAAPIYLHVSGNSG